MPKSRYGSVSLYISEYWMNRPQDYNDIDAPHDPAIFDRLRNHGTSVWAAFAYLEADARSQASTSCYRDTSHIYLFGTHL